MGYPWDWVLWTGYLPSEGLLFLDFDFVDATGDNAVAAVFGSFDFHTDHLFFGGDGLYLRFLFFIVGAGAQGEACCACHDCHNLFHSLIN